MASKKPKAEDLSKKDIKRMIEEEGYIHANFLFEIVGNPKEHVETALKMFLENIDADQQVICLRKDVEEVIQLEGEDLFSVAAEVEYLVLGLEKFTWLAFNFMPASVEVIAPKEITFSDKDFGMWMNDLLAKLHEVNTMHTTVKSEHSALVKNLNAVIRNSIVLVLKGKEMTAEEIGPHLGMGEASVVKFLEAMEKEKKIVSKNGTYKLA